MKIPIETKEEKDQPEEKEAWMEKLHHNAAIMSACRNFFPEGPECVWCALFKSIVPSISQGNAGKLFELGLDLFRKADKSIESIDNRIMFEGVEPPGPPPPVVGSAPGPTDNCMFCNSGSLLQTVFLSDGEEGYRNEAYICMKCLRKLVLKEPCPMGFSKSLFGYPPSPKPPPVTSDDQPVCCLCGSRDLLQTVFHSKCITTPSDASLSASLRLGSVAPLSYICMRCLRNLIDKERQNAGKRPETAQDMSYKE